MLKLIKPINGENGRAVEYSMCGSCNGWPVVHRNAIVSRGRALRLGLSAYLPLPFVARGRDGRCFVTPYVDSLAGRCKSKNKGVETQGILVGSNPLPDCPETLDAWTCM